MQNIKEISRELKASLLKKEEIQKLLSNLESLRTSGGLTLQRYDFLKSDYQKQMEMAVSRIAAVKSYISNALQTPKQSLNSAKTELETVRASYNTGTVSLDHLHKQEEKINQRIRNYRAEIADLQFLIDAKSSHQLSTDYTTLDSSLNRKGWPAWATALAIILPILIFGIVLGSWLIPPIVNTNNNAYPSIAENTTNQSQTVINEDWQKLTNRIKSSVVFILCDKGDGGGSGTVIDSRGYVLTNNHVISNSKTSRVYDEIRVYFYNEGREIKYADTYYLARVIYRDETKDTAIIKISADQALPEAIKLGNTDLLRGEEDIRVIGYPLVYIDRNSLSFGFPSVTPGIISELPRKYSFKLKNSNYELIDCSCMRLSAELNRGNSGGAVINRKGEIIGIPTVTLGEEGSHGYYAITINQAKSTIDKALGE